MVLLPLFVRVLVLLFTGIGSYLRVLVLFCVYGIGYCYCLFVCVVIGYLRV